MKSYTDIEQSQKLAEILPLESADMYYNLGESKIPNFIYGSHSDFECYTMCWSLAALMILMRDYDCVWIGANDVADWQCEFNLGKGEHHIEKANTPIDACYEMILKLHGLNLL